jgi:hypothetical protein
MEHKSLFITKEALITELFPFFGYADDNCKTLRSLCKKTKEYYESNPEAYHRIFKRRTLKLHYPKFERLVPALEKNNRWSQFKLDFQLKFPDDFPIMEQFIKDHPKVKFSHLHLVINDDSLAAANSLIDTMRSVGMLGERCDRSYAWLDSSNYCRAANMNTKLRFESEMIIGAEPTAFIEKVEEVGHLDVRNVSRCPVDEIDFTVYSINVDAEFCTLFESGAKQLKERFSQSVRKAIFEDEAKKVAETLDQHVQNLQNGYPNCENIHLLLSGNELKGEELQGMFSHPLVHRVEYEGLEAEKVIKIESNNVFFTITDGSNNYTLKAFKFIVEFQEDGYKAEKDYVIIDPKKCNIVAERIVRDKTTQMYDDTAELSLDGKSIVLHKSQIHHVQFKSVPDSAPKLFPLTKLSLYVDERPTYEFLNAYLAEVPNAIPVAVELDMAFLDDIEESKQVVTNLFAKNLAVLDIVMEMHEPAFIDHLYGLASQSETLRACTPIVHQDTAKTVEFIKSATRVEQFIIDMRIPWDEQQAAVKEMLAEEKSNRFVLQDVHEWCIEYRYPTSFERVPIV